MNAIRLTDTSGGWNSRFDIYSGGEVSTLESTTINGAAYTPLKTIASEVNFINSFNASTVMTVKTSATSSNVGIGTTNPAQLLDVQGSDTSPAIEVTNSTSTANRFPRMGVRNYTGTGGTGGWPGLVLTQSRGTKASPAALQSGDNLGAIFFYGSSDTSGASQAGAAIFGISSGAFSGSSAASDLTFNTTASGATWPSERMRINAAGNVGIGTATPTRRLEVPWVSGDTTMTAYFGSSNAANNQTAIRGQSFSATGVSGISNSGYGGFFSSFSGAGIYSQSSTSSGIDGLTTDTGGGAAGVLGRASGYGYGGKFTSAYAASGFFQTSTTDGS
ncbi:MAG: hypothetical protein K2X47_17055, partial [Bdellovibrionales bacterium]|nr:hypothetical protein [Bdellovibrionales bacterium]